MDVTSAIGFLRFLLCQPSGFERLPCRSNVSPSPSRGDSFLLVFHLVGSLDTLDTGASSLRLHLQIVCCCFPSFPLTAKQQVTNCTEDEPPICSTASGHRAPSDFEALRQLDYCGADAVRRWGGEKKQKSAPRGMGHIARLD